MSRIYEALKQSDKGSPILELIDGSESRPIQPPDGDRIAGLEDAANGYRGHHIELPEVDVQVKQNQASGATEFRTVRLRVPAGIPVFPFDGTDSRASEQYRILRTNLLQHPLQPKTIGVSSATPGDGKTITAINIAATLALKGESKVLLVDADLRQCTIGRALALEDAPGLGEVLRGTCSLEQAIIRIEQIPSLHILPSGAATCNPAELLDSAVFRALAATLREQFSFVILDTTPTAAVADFQLVLQVCDGIVIVVRPDHTNRKAFWRALQIEPPHKLLGTVINAVDDWFLWRTNEHYGYYSGGPRSRPSLGILRS